MPGARFAYPPGGGGSGALTLGMSTGGNTLGTTGLVQSQMVFVGGDNITLSQSVNGQSATLSISAAAGGGGALTEGISTQGNTSGTTGLVASRYLFVGGNNVTLSQSVNGQSATLTISAANETQTVPPIATAVKVAVSTLASTGTISRFAPEDHMHQGINSAGISNVGNTAGTSGAGPGRMVFAGGNNVTLSQATDATGSTITISAANETQTVPPIGTAVKAVSTIGSTGTITRFAPEDHQHIGINSAGISTGGNTAGTSGAGPGRLVFVGGNNVTLSQGTDATGSTITISAANETQTVPPIATAVAEVVSALSTGTITRFAPEDHAHRGVNLVQISGNTSNTSNIVYGSVYLAGGNNITLSQVSAAGKATITISAFNQTAPVVSNAIQSVSSATGSGTNTSRFAADDHQHAGVGPLGISSIGNTAGDTGTQYGRVVFAGGNNITLSVSSSNNGAQTITISAANAGAGAGFTGGMSTGGNTSGTTGMADSRMVFVGGNAITLSQSIDAGAHSATLTISAANQTAPTFSYFDNMDMQAAGIGQSATSAGTLMVFPLLPHAGNVFPGNATFGTMMFDMSGSSNNTMSAARTMTLSVGIYTMNNATRLSLLNSGSTSWQNVANVSASSLYHKGRWLTINSSLFSASLSFSQAQYYMAVWIQSSGSTMSLSFNGMFFENNAIRSGTLGVAQNTGNSTEGWYPFLGCYSVTTAGLPAAIGMTDIDVNQPLAGFIPHFALNSLTASL